MKVKIINEKLKDFGLEFKARRINYDQVVVNYTQGNGLFTFELEDVELISEGEVDDILIKHPFLLKIKIYRGISIFFYKALLENLKDTIDEEIEEVNLLKDIYKEINKRGGWEKEILMVANDKYPIKIIVTGMNFKRSSYAFNSKIIENGEFLEICNFEINKIKTQIEFREILLSRYGMALQQLKGNPIINANNLLPTE